MVALVFGPVAATPEVPVISGIYETNLSTASVSIGWDVSPASQGQIEYGTTTGLGSVTTLETEYLDAHEQDITGLTDDTTYYYRIKAISPTDQVVYSDLGTFTTIAVAGEFPPSGTLVNIPMNNDPMPAYLATITDSTWGTKIRRISDVAGQRNRYPNDQVWNADGSRLLLLGTGVSLRRLRDGNTYEDLGAVTAGNSLWWSNTDPDVAYSLYENTRLFRIWDHNTNTESTVRDFSTTHADQPTGYTVIRNGDVPHISLDDHLTTFYGQLPNGTWDFLCYDPIDDRIEAKLNFATSPHGGAPSYDGNYVTVDHGGTRYVYTMTARVGTTPGTLNLVRTIGSAGHGCPGMVDGNAVYFRAGGVGDVIRLDNGVSTSLNLPSNLTDGYASYAVDREGWTYWSSEYVTTVSARSQRGYGQCVAVKGDGSGEVQVFGFNHNMNTSPSGSTLQYYRRPFASVNRDGTKMIFGSDWHGEEAYSGSVYAFVAGMDA